MKALNSKELKKVRGGAVDPEPSPQIGGMLGRISSFFQTLFSRISERIGGRGGRL